MLKTYLCGRYLVKKKLVAGKKIHRIHIWFVVVFNTVECACSSYMLTIAQEFASKGRCHL